MFASFESVDLINGDCSSVNSSVSARLIVSANHNIWQACLKLVRDVSDAAMHSYLWGS
jgi:hypothetical protein